MEPIATPSSLEFVAALHKTRSGKILRRSLKAKEAGLMPECSLPWRLIRGEIVGEH